MKSVMKFFENKSLLRLMITILPLAFFFYAADSFGAAVTGGEKPVSTEDSTTAKNVKDDKPKDVKKPSDRRTAQGKETKKRPDASVADAEKFKPAGAAPGAPTKTPQMQPKDAAAPSGQTATAPAQKTGLTTSAPAQASVQPAGLPGKSEAAPATPPSLPAGSSQAPKFSEKQPPAPSLPQPAATAVTASQPTTAAAAPQDLPKQQAVAAPVQATADSTAKQAEALRQSPITPPVQAASGAAPVAGAPSPVAAATARPAEAPKQPAVVPPGQMPVGKLPSAPAPIIVARPPTPATVPARPTEAPKQPVVTAPVQVAKEALPVAGPPAKPPALPPSLPAMPVPQQQPAKDSRYITIDFDNVDIQVFVRFISEMTGKNFVFDDKVKGKVTVLSPRKITVDEAYKVFESVMDVNGFVAVPAGEVVKIIPVQQAKEKQTETRVDGGKVSPEDKMITQIISLNHANPEELKKLLDPLIARTSVLVPYQPTGMLIINDLASNIKRLQEIVEAIDQEGVGEQITYIPLKFASATDIVKALTAIFQQYKGMAPVKFVADDRTNAVIVMATENDAKRIKDLIALMDRGISKGASMLHVYKLQHATAEDLAKVLMNLPKAGAAGVAGAAGAAAAPASSPFLSKNVQIVADKATNSLIITAERADYLVLEGVIRQLDVNRPMVYIETLIMEVSVSKNFNLGVEWRGVTTYQDTGGVIGGFSGSGYTNTTGLIPVPSTSTTSTTSVPSLPQGMALGVVGKAINLTLGGTTYSFPSFTAMLQASQTLADISVIAKPQLLTLTNEEAEINISKNVPYITRQDTSSTGTTINYSNYEYKDVGIIIKITPYINEDGLIRLKIDQNVSTIDTSSDQFRPTTRKRSAKTTVVLQDGNTVVMGGLIQENNETDNYKIPLLGDIPLLGWLFKYQRKTYDKTNLFLFISPKIVRTADDAAAITIQKNSEAGIIQEGVVRMYDNKKDKPKANQP